MVELTLELARELLDYDPDTGLLTWRVRRNSKAMPGSLAGTKTKDGYFRIELYEKNYLAHRLAWFIFHGTWPIDQIDHINGIRDDNRITNLRDVSREINAQNMRRPVVGNTSGYIGVTWEADRQSFKSQINIHGKVLRLGNFTDPAKAHYAYVMAKRKLHPGCTL